MNTTLDFRVLEPVPETKAIEQFISIITKDWSKHGQACVLEIRCLHESLGVRFEHFPTVAVQQAASYAIQLNQEGYNCYVVVNPICANTTAGSPAKDDVILAGHFCFADADDIQSSEKLRQVQPKPDFFVVTGTTPFERIHGYWALEEYCDNLEAWTQVQKNIAQNLGTDKAVTNPSRIMRIAGTVSWPSRKKREKGYQAELVTLQLSEGVFG